VKQQIRIVTDSAAVNVLDRVTRNIGDAPLSVVPAENLRALLARQGYIGGLSSASLNAVEDEAVVGDAGEVAGNASNENTGANLNAEPGPGALGLGPWAQLLAHGPVSELAEPSKVSQDKERELSTRATNARIRRAQEQQEEAARAGDVLVKARKGAQHLRLPKADLSPAVVDAIENLLPRCSLGYAFIGSWSAAQVREIKRAWIIDDSAGEAVPVKFAFEVQEELDGTPEQIERLVGAWVHAMQAAEIELRAKIGARLAKAQQRVERKAKPADPKKPRTKKAQPAQQAQSEPDKQGVQEPTVQAGSQGTQPANPEIATASEASSLPPESTASNCELENEVWGENLQPQLSNAGDEGFGPGDSAAILKPPAIEAMADDEIALMRRSPFAFVKAATPDARQHHAAKLAASASLLRDVQVGPGQGLHAMTLPLVPTVRFVGKLQALAKAVGAKLSATKLRPRSSTDGLLDASTLSPVHALPREQVLMPGGMPLCMPIPHEVPAPSEPLGPPDVLLADGEELTLRCERWDAVVRVHYAGPEGVIFSTILDALESYAGPLQLMHGEDLALRVEQAAQLLASEHRALLGCPKPKAKATGSTSESPVMRLPSFDELCEQTDMVMTDLALRTDLLERLADRETQLPAHGVHLVSILRKWERVSTASGMLSTSIEQLRAWCAELASVALERNGPQAYEDLFSTAAACHELQAISGIVMRAKSWLAIYTQHHAIVGGAVGALRMRI
jgi:hypothetical protein